MENKSKNYKIQYESDKILIKKKLSNTYIGVIWTSISILTTLVILKSNLNGSDFLKKLISIDFIIFLFASLCILLIYQIIYILLNIKGKGDILIDGKKRCIFKCGRKIIDFDNIGKITIALSEKEFPDIRNQLKLPTLYDVKIIHNGKSFRIIKGDILENLKYFTDRLSKISMIPIEIENLESYKEKEDDKKIYINGKKFIKTVIILFVIQILFSFLCELGTRNKLLSIAADFSLYKIYRENEYKPYFSNTPLKYNFVIVESNDQSHIIKEIYYQFWGQIVINYIDKEGLVHTESSEGLKGILIFIPIIGFIMLIIAHLHYKYNFSLLDVEKNKHQFLLKSTGQRMLYYGLIIFISGLCYTPISILIKKILY